MYDVGQQVVCVKDDFEIDALPHMNQFPLKGEVYTVRDVVPAVDWDNKETCAILLLEVVNPLNPHGVENAFAAERFRALDEVEVQATKVEVEPTTVGNALAYLFGK